MKFEIGENFDGIYRGYHHAMMHNELRNGEGAYELSWAGDNRSGPSFGGNQMDIAYNKYGRSVFLDIVRNAQNNDGNSILSTSEVSQIEQTVSKKRNIVGRPVNEVFGDTTSRKIDEALRSVYGKQMIHKAYVNEMLSRAFYVDSFINSLQEGPGKNFAKTDIGKICIFDYNNQYGIQVNGALDTFLNGRAFTLESGKILGPITKQDFNFEDFKKDFLFHLKYYSNNPDDVIRRLKNIEKYFSNGNNFVDRNTGSNPSMCKCVELFNISKICTTNPLAIMALGKPMKECRSSIEASAEYRDNAYNICKELYGMDYESYVKHTPSAQAKL
jgi:hypothetical protein